MDREVADAQRDDVEWSLVWAAWQGGLRGELTARNVGRRSIVLGNKPDLQPVGRDGVPLDAHTLWTLEYRGPPVVLPPGRTATATVSWGGWNGPAASSQFLVRWDGGQTRVWASGPCQPEATGPATNLTANRYELDERK